MFLSVVVVLCIIYGFTCSIFVDGCLKVKIIYLLLGDTLTNHMGAMNKDR